MNTRIIGNKFNYHAPSTLAEAIELVVALPNAKILAGGTDLIVKMKVDANMGIENIIDIKRIPELDYININESCNCLCFGALAKLAVIEKREDVKTQYTALYEALKAMASISVRNMATLVGNVCNASPVADTAGPSIGFGAKIFLAGPQGERIVAIEDFFTGPGKTVMAKDEMVTCVAYPKMAENTGSAFIKKTRVKPDISKISATAVLTNDNGKASYCRIAMGSIAATPLYLKELSDSLIGKEITKDVIAKAAKTAAETIKPIDDNRTTATYRKDIAALLVEEVLTKAWTRAGGAL